MNKRLISILFLSVFLLSLLTSCGVSATSASCGFVVGNGVDDSDLHKIIYPGQKVPISENKNVFYVPCNDRNYLITDGTVTDANASVIGDRKTLITAYTSSGTPIKIGVSAFWTLNQSYEAMEKFYKICHKYTCYSEQDIGGGAMYSTEGWNGMLGENFGPAIVAAAQIAAYKVDDTIWSKHDPAKKQELAANMAEVFPEVMAAAFGSNIDLFCGSGTSTWPDPKKPGEGDFYCSPVYFRVESVTLGDISPGQDTAAVAAMNKQRLQNARILYGEGAEKWLAMQDLVTACKNAQTTCVFNIGGVDTPTPVPNP